MTSWIKVFREIWMNLGRSVLVVISIAIGVTAIGIVVATQQSLAAEIPASYAQINPASASLNISSFDDELLKVIRKLPEVAAAEGRNTLTIQLQTGPDTWKPVNLVVIPDFNHMTINRIFPQSGNWPPLEQELLFERASIDLTGTQVGNTILIETSDGRQRNMKVAGLAHDMSEPSGTFINQIKGYISLDTLEWLGFDRSYNELLLVAKSGVDDYALSQATAFQVRDRVEKSGRTVYWTHITDPSQHWFLQFLDPMSAVLTALGVLSLLLSCFLVINTISALMAQQTRQVGIMKSFGARLYQIIGLYIASVLIFGGLAMAAAAPLSELGARKCIEFLFGLINFNMPKFVYPQRLLQFQLLFSLVVPCFVSLFPILSGARVSVLKALTFTGMGESRFGVSLFDRFISLFRGLPRPVLVSLRNTFRKKTRLGLTLLALSLGSAVFIAVASLQTTLINTLDQALQYYNFDVMVSFGQQYRVEKIQATTFEIPGVSDCETWGMVDSHLVRSDGSESESIMLVAPPSDTQMINPTLIQGRWLVPEDENAVVINNDVVRENPDLKVGSEIILKIDGKKVHWIIVGIVKSVMIGPWAYTNYPYFANRLNRAGNAGAVYIQTRGLQESNQAEIVNQLADQYKKAGMHVSSISQVSELRNTATLQFNVIIIFLMIFAVLIALIGGLGVMGTMSLNVIERSREIGIMRAIGARNLVVLQIVMFEGAVIGIISWAAGCLLAYPIGNLLSELIGSSFLQSTMEFVFSREGAVFWLGCVLLLSMIASFFPAFNATRISIREVLAYE